MDNILALAKIRNVLPDFLPSELKILITEYLALEFDLNTFNLLAQFLDAGVYSNYFGEYSGTEILELLKPLQKYGFQPEKYKILTDEDMEEFYDDLYHDLEKVAQSIKSLAPMIIHDQDVSKWTSPLILLYEEGKPLTYFDIFRRIETHFHLTAWAEAKYSGHINQDGTNTIELYLSHK